MKRFFFLTFSISLCLIATGFGAFILYSHFQPDVFHWEVIHRHEWDLPETSLGLPTLVQILFSAVFIALILINDRFYPQGRSYAMVITAAAILRQLQWRGLETLNTSTALSTFWSTLLFLAEVAAFIYLLLGYLQTLQIKRRIPNKQAQQKLALNPPTVDIFIPVLTEPLSTIETTLMSCLGLSYTNKTIYLVDDHLDEARASLAQKLGVHYVQLEGKDSGRTELLNKVLQQSQGEYVCLLQADMAPIKPFFERVLPNLIADPQLAFVQTRTHFYAPDPFQRNLLAEQVTNNEQDLFFHTMQTGNDAWDTAFLMGSGSVIRRKALDEVGGFSTNTAKDELVTGYEIHQRGWKSLYIGEYLSTCFSEQTFLDFVNDRVRWARGVGQLLLKQNPLSARQLNWYQKVCYLAGTAYFFEGIPRLVFLIAPLSFLFFQVPPFHATFAEILIYYGPSFICMAIGYSIIHQGHRESLWAEVYETALCAYLTFTALLTLLSPQKAAKHIQNRLKSGLGLTPISTQLFISVLLWLGLGVYIARTVVMNYWGEEGVWIYFIWTFYNLFILGGVMLVANERPRYRITPRIYKALSCELRLLDGTIAFGKTTDISETGFSATFVSPIPLSGTMPVKILDWDIDTANTFFVQAVRSAINDDQSFSVGFRFQDNLNAPQPHGAKALAVQHMYGSIASEKKLRSLIERAQSMRDFLMTPMRMMSHKSEDESRRMVRFPKTLSAQITLNNEQKLMGVSEEISEVGINLSLPYPNPLKEGDTVSIAIRWSEDLWTQTKATVSRIEGVALQKVSIGFQFIQMGKEERLQLIQLLFPKPFNTSGAGSSLVRVATPTRKAIPCFTHIANEEKPFSGLTRDISELGCTITLKNRIDIAKGEIVSIKFQWNSQTSTVLKGIVQTVDYSGHGRLPVLTVHFVDLSMPALDQLNQLINT